MRPSETQALTDTEYEIEPAGETLASVGYTHKQFSLE
jgi:hypothetical protein